MHPADQHRYLVLNMRIIQDKLQLWSAGQLGVSFQIMLDAKLRLEFVLANGSNLAGKGHNNLHILKEILRS